MLGPWTPFCRARPTLAAQCTGRKSCRGLHTGPSPTFWFVFFGVEIDSLPSPSSHRLFLYLINAYLFTFSFSSPSLRLLFVCHAQPNPIVFIDIQIGGQDVGRIKFELFADTCTYGEANFRTSRRTLMGVLHIRGDGGTPSVFCLEVAPYSMNCVLTCAISMARNIEGPLTAENFRQFCVGEPRIDKVGAVS